MIGVSICLWEDPRIKQIRSRTTPDNPMNHVISFISILKVRRRLSLFYRYSFNGIFFPPTFVVDRVWRVSAGATPLTGIPARTFATTIPTPHFDSPPRDIKRFNLIE